MSILYGTQGSGSIFPSREERLAFRQQSEQGLLKQVFEDLAQRVDAQGRIEGTINEILGGPLDARTLSRYAARFEVPEPRVYGGWTTCLRIETADDDRHRARLRQRLPAVRARPPEQVGHRVRSGTFTCLAAIATSTTPKGSTRPPSVSTRETTCMSTAITSFCARWTTTSASSRARWPGPRRACRRRSSSA